MRRIGAFQLIQIKPPAHLRAQHQIGMSPARTAPQKSSMPKFALKMLLTNLTIGRGYSRRISGLQAASAVLMLFMLATVGLYVWRHGGN